MDEDFKNDLKPIMARTSAQIIAVMIAGAISFFGSRALGLFQGFQGTEIPGEFIVDGGMIVFGAALGVALIASTIAAKKASIGRASVLGVLSGFLSGAILLVVAKFGIYQGPPVFAAAIIAALVIGFGLQLLLNRQTKTA
jgi:hypothetical protein